MAKTMCSAGLAVGASVLLWVSVSSVSAAPEDRLSYDHDQSLAQADFSGRKDLKMAIFTKANCQGANFRGADLENANLEDANFIESDLTGANLRGILGTKTRFVKAKLDDAVLEEANLVGAVLNGVSIEGADFTDALLEPFQVRDQTDHQCRDGWQNGARECEIQ